MENLTDDIVFQKDPVEPWLYCALLDLINECSNGVDVESPAPPKNELAVVSPAPEPVATPAHQVQVNVAVQNNISTRPPKGSGQKVIEEATGKTWASVAEFIRLENPNQDVHQVYRSIKTRKPLDDGRLVIYANGKGQRKPGEPFKKMECGACGYVPELGLKPRICPKCFGSNWVEIKPAVKVD